MGETTGFGTQVLSAALTRGVTGWWQEYLGIAPARQTGTESLSPVERAERVRLAHGVGCPVAPDYDAFTSRRNARLARKARVAQLRNVG